MKCSKCNKNMELLFNLYRCYHCSTPTEQKREDNDGYIRIGDCFCKEIALKNKRFFVIKILDRFITLSKEDIKRVCRFLAFCNSNTKKDDRYFNINNYSFHYDGKIDILVIRVESVGTQLNTQEIDDLFELLERFAVKI